MQPVPLDPERLYRLLADGAWGAFAEALYLHRAALDAAPTAARAAELFVAAFLEAVRADGPAAHAGVLDKLFLLHVGGFYRLEANAFERVVVHLVHAHAADAVAAAGYARHCPTHPECAAALRPFAAASAAQPAPDIRASRSEAAGPTPAPDALRSLFRSRQEGAFFRAAQAVYREALVYPNVALHAVVDLDALRPFLSAAERRYGQRALLDCVVFDAHSGRPRLAFELDSPLHDDPDRRRRDGYKERTCHLAGLPLYRLRPEGSAPDAAAFERLLRELRAGNERLG